MSTIPAVSALGDSGDAWVQFLGTLTWTCSCGRINKRRLTPTADKLLRCTARECGRVIHLDQLVGYGGRDRHRVLFRLL